MGRCKRRKNNLYVLFLGKIRFLFVATNAPSFRRGGGDRSYFNEV